MKELYTKPQAEIEEFRTLDVLTTSSVDTDNKPDTDIPWGS